MVPVSGKRTEPARFRSPGLWRTRKWPSFAWKLTLPWSLIPIDPPMWPSQDKTGGLHGRFVFHAEVCSASRKLLILMKMYNSQVNMLRLLVQEMNWPVMTTRCGLLMLFWEWIELGERQRDIAVRKLVYRCGDVNFTEIYVPTSNVQHRQNDWKWLSRLRKADNPTPFKKSKCAYPWRQDICFHKSLKHTHATCPEM